MRIDDGINAIFAFPLGFFLGVAGAGLAQLYVQGGWWLAVILGGGTAVLFAAMLGVNRLFDRLGDRVFDGAVRRWGKGPALGEKDAPRSWLLRYLFLAGALAGALLSAIYSPSVVLDWVPSLSFLGA